MYVYAYEDLSLVLGVPKKNRNNLKILCQIVCNRLYIYVLGVLLICICYTCIHTWCSSHMYASYICVHTWCIIHMCTYLVYSAYVIIILVYILGALLIYMCHTYIYILWCTPLYIFTWCTPHMYLSYMYTYLVLSSYVCIIHVCTYFGVLLYIYLLGVPLICICHTCIHTSSYVYAIHVYILGALPICMHHTHVYILYVLRI